MATNDDNRTILVLGATGKTGRRVADQLRQRDYDVRAASRRGATRFDWGDESTWAPALDGARGAYVIDSQGADAAEKVAAFGELATAKGVERLALLSARDFALSGDAELLAVERAAQATSDAWTILRPAWFTQNFAEAAFFRDPVMRGEFVISTGDGLEPFVDADDIAAVAVAALTEDGHRGETYELSGPRLLSFGDAIAEIAAASGRRIRYVPVDRDVFLAQGGSLGGEVVAGLFDDIAAGRHAHLSDGVQRATGREPRDFSDYVKAAAAAGAWKD